MGLQYRHLLPASVDRTSANVWLHEPPRITCKKKPTTLMNHITYTSKLPSVVTLYCLFRKHACFPYISYDMFKSMMGMVLYVSCTKHSFLSHRVCIPSRDENKQGGFTECYIFLIKPNSKGFQQKHPHIFTLYIFTLLWLSPQNIRKIWSLSHQIWTARTALPLTDT